MPALNKVILSLAAVSAALLAAGCTNTPTYPPAPVKSAVQDWNYLIGPGDSVNVFVWRNPEVSGSFPVRPDGKMIEKSLSKYIQEPIVTVIVGGGVGPFSQQIRVVGEAAKPQALNFREDMSLVDLMIAVGGLTDFAAGNKAYILRTEGGKQQKLGVRLESLIKNGDYSANVDLRPGDVLVIPESLF
jgi:polysaccharide biosynthesis/export protein